MTNYSLKAVQGLGQRLHVDSEFLVQCLDESVIEVQISGEELNLDNGTAFRLRRLQRLCHTFNIDLSVAILLNELSHRVVYLEKEIAHLKTRLPASISKDLSKE